MRREPSPIVRWLARAICRVFYRVDCVGEVPGRGATLLLPNHPNALLDPVVIWATAGRDVRFLAKSTLFAGPFGIVLRSAGAIPVYRRQDQGADRSRNAEMFADVAKALAGGDAVCIFPEGISHSTGRLEPLRTGAARMVLTAERNGTSVALVAVGLNFDRKTVFRSRVTVVYGRPFAANDLAAPAGDDYPAAVRELTNRVAGHIRGLLIEADPVADAALVDRVDRLYAAARDRQSHPADRLERRRAIAAGIERLRADSPERYDSILMRLRRYDQRLQRFGLRDRHLDWQVSTGTAVRFAVRELLLAVILVPIAVLGLVSFVVPYQLTGLVARRVTRERDVIATAQVLAGAAIYAAWVGLLAALAWWMAGITVTMVALVGLPVVAIASLLAIERELAVVDAVRAWFLLRRSRVESRERLRRHRSELADVLDEVYEWLEGGRAERRP